MWLMMQLWQYEIFRRQSPRYETSEKAAYETQSLARAGRNSLLRRTVGWLVRQLAAWQALQDELDRPTARRQPIPPGTPIGEAL